VLPVTYSDWNESKLTDEALVLDITLHLQELGNNITAEKVIEFLAWSDIVERHGITKKSVSIQLINI
jgi:hypothetical protein